MRDVQFVVNDVVAEYSVSINGVRPREFSTEQNLIGFMATELTGQEMIYAFQCDSLRSD